MAGWSLRTKLVAVATIALLPVLLLLAWRAHGDALAARDRRLAAANSAAEVAIARHREQLEASRRLLLAVCSDEDIERAASATASPAEVERCEGYLQRLLRRFADEYSAALVTDNAGVVRCASVPAAVGVSLADREVFRLVRDGGKLAVGSSIASRVTPSTIIPVAIPVGIDGPFRGMCAVGISLKAFADSVTAQSGAGTASLSLVDRNGGALAGQPQALLALPVAAQLASAIASHRMALVEQGQDGFAYRYQIAPLSDGSIFVVAAVPIGETAMSLLLDWLGFALCLLASAVALLAIWLGADRWCTRPLREIEIFAGKVARGETLDFGAPASWSPEVVAVGQGVRALAAAIASRENGLRAGLEQRDHMLREIHHRVKNNLQMISSLLNLQAGEIRSARIRRFFGDAQNRVLTLSILHRHLYERSSWSLVDFQQFISDLVRQLTVGRSRSGGERTLPRYHIRAPIMAVGPDTAIPVGLIVTEAVTSALSHDFGGVAQPEIRIEATEKEGRTVELAIEDNGRDVGYGTISPDGRGGFGLTLVRGLAMQLDGAVQLAASASGGTRLVVTFELHDEAVPGREGATGG